MSAQFEHPDFPREIADAPDIDNVPAASSMHTLMGAVAEIHNGVCQILEAMSPEATADRARAIAPLAMELAKEFDQEEPVHEDIPPELRDLFTPTPLDPSKVKAGDTVRLEDGPEADADYAGGKVTYVGRDGEQAVRGVWSIRIKGLGVFEVGPHKWTLTAHQPAPEPEPEWKPGTLAIVTPSMWGGIVNRAIRGTDGGWNTEAGGHWDDDEVSDVHELVVIDPAAVDVDALVEVAHHDRVLYGDTTPDQMRRAILRILAHMGIEATS